MTSRNDHAAGCSHAAHEPHDGQNSAESTQGAVVRDPVCGMEVDTRTASHKLQLGDTTYHFCSSRCLEKFAADPDHYLNPPERGAAVQKPAIGALAQAAKETIWTCPMHPQIRRNGPGQCPICGMALEPLEPTLDEGPNPELIDMTRRFWASAAL